MQQITSLRNPAVLAARSLQTRRGREESGLFLCDGEHMVAEAVHNAPESIEAVYVDELQTERFQSILRSVAPERLYAVPAHVLAAISQVKTPQGIAATVRKPQPVTFEHLGDKIILLENVQDPGNVGTVLRTADAAGFSGCVLTSGCADPFSPKALRATMGSVFRVPVVETDSAPEAAHRLAGGGYAVVAAVLDGEDFYTRQPLPQKVCLIVGNEGAGITPETARAASHRFRLPMRGGAESLNAAVAAAVMMYEIVHRG